jgi:hyaluronoglucosaminidase
MHRRLVALLAPCLLAACASTVDGFTQDELCGTAAATFDISPAPLVTRSSGQAFPVPSSVSLSGVPPTGALKDALTALGWTQDQKSSFVLHVEGSATLTEIERTCHATLPALPGAYALISRPGSILIAGAPEGQANALATLAQLPSGGELPRASILDGPALGQRFVLEGFYGPPWTWDTRTQVLHAAAAQKQNVYLYAPKGDFVSRFLWQVPFDPVTLASARTFVADAASLAVQVCWEISPGGAISFSDPTAQQAMEAKLKSLADIGVSCLVLAFDDTAMTLSTADQTVYPDFATGQLSFLNMMAAYLKTLPGAVHLHGVTGNTYSTLMMQAHPSYIATLAQLDRSVEIGWTGLDIVSGEVTAADVALAASILGRPPALGDNYPVSGSDLVSGPLNLWPIDNRDPAAIPGLSAYGGNGMTLARASLPAFASEAELAWNPTAYDPQRAFTHGLRMAAGGTFDGLTFFAQLADGLNASGPNAAPQLRALLDEYGYDASSEPLLAAFFQRMAGIDSELGNIHPELLTELQPWIAKCEAWGRLGTDLLAAFRMPSGTVTAAMIASLQTELAQAQGIPAVIADGPMETFATQTLASIPVSKGD